MPTAFPTEEKSLGQGFDRPLWGRLLGYTRAYAGPRQAVLWTTIIRAAQRPLQFWAVAAIINGPIARGDYRGTLWAAAAFVGLVLSTAVVYFLRHRAMMQVGEGLVHDLRNDLFDHLHQMPPSYFHKTKLGRILSRMVADVEATRRGVQLTLFIGQEFLQLGICAALMLYYSWGLFLVLLALTPLVLWANRHFRPRLHRFTRVAAESASRLTGVLAESVRGIRVIQGYTRQTRGETIFGTYAGQLAGDNVRLASETALFNPLLGLAGQVFIAGMFLLGGYGALHGWAGMDITSLVAFFFIPTSFFLSLQAAANYYPQILAAQVGAERVFQLIDLAPEWADAADARALPDPRGGPGFEGARVELRRVHFGYNLARLVLHDISLVARPGETIALVGHTGSGKSSIVNLVAKFYLPTRGTVLIDDHDVGTLRASSLRRQMGIVSQVNFLFTGTVLDNIRLGRPQATDEEVRESARQLDCLDLLESLPGGLETEVGEGGNNLSLGQRQLVCFARALLANPRLLILDEATSAVDPVTENRLQRALARLLRGRTSFVVAHRLSTIVQADQILVLEYGRIIERGTHRQLLGLPGAYRALYREFVSSGSASTASAPVRKEATTSGTTLEPS